MTNKNLKKTTIKYICESCDFNCSKTQDYNRHILTPKHKKSINLNQIEPEKSPTSIFTCKNCSKTYKARNGLWYHEQKCIVNKVLPENIIVSDSSNNNVIQLLIKENSDFKTIIMDLIKNNTELQKQMLEVCKNSNNNNTTINANNNTSINNNKTFNLQFFLNEQCKDAMNLSDFVKSVQLTLPDLEKVDEEGYVNGMSNLIIAKLNELDIYKRPVHCSDAKRDTMHVKEDDKWEREDPEHSKLTVAVKDIEKKNFLLLNDYKEKYPDCLDLESIHNDKYLHMMMTLAASGPDEYKKVVKKMAKTVIIEKE